MITGYCDIVCHSVLWTTIALTSTPSQVLHSRPPPPPCVCCDLCCFIGSEEGLHINTRYNMYIVCSNLDIFHNIGQHNWYIHFPRNINILGFRCVFYVYTLLKNVYLMDDSSYRLNFDLGKKYKIHHYS